MHGFFFSPRPPGPFPEFKSEQMGFNFELAKLLVEEVPKGDLFFIEHDSIATLKWEYAIVLHYLVHQLCCECYDDVRNKRMAELWANYRRPLQVLPHFERFKKLAAELTESSSDDYYEMLTVALEDDVREFKEQRPPQYDSVDNYLKFVHGEVLEVRESLKELWAEHNELRRKVDEMKKTVAQLEERACDCEGEYISFEHWLQKRAMNTLKLQGKKIDRSLLKPLPQPSLHATIASTLRDTWTLCGEVQRDNLHMQNMCRKLQCDVERLQKLNLSQAERDKLEAWLNI